MIRPGLAKWAVPFEDLKDAIKPYLTKPLRYSIGWQYQGLGMIRVYLSPEKRLHVWYPPAAVPNVSTIHTHPWDFDSLVLSGQLLNTRLSCAPGVTPLAGAEWVPFNRATIQCGPGGGIRTAPDAVMLYQHGPELYEVGDHYCQKAEEIHHTSPTPGAVTLVTRRFREDKDLAFVYYPKGEEWVSAEPRPATTAEIDIFCDAALAGW